MNDSKVTAAHLRRTAVIYVRQSSLAQVDRNKESTRPPIRSDRTGPSVGLAERRGAGDR